MTTPHVRVRASSEPDVYVLMISHRHGDDITLHPSNEAARQALAEFVRQWWHEIVCEDRDTPGVTSQPPREDDEAIQVYFDHQDDESYTITPAAMPRDEVVGDLSRRRSMRRTKRQYSARQRRERAVNMNAQFLPQCGDDESPALVVAGALAVMYVEDGELYLGVDLETADQAIYRIYGDQQVPLHITVHGDTVFEATASKSGEERRDGDTWHTDGSSPS